MKRWIAALLSAVLLLSVSGAALAADPDTVEISSAEDLAELSALCTSDAWSEGKTIVLTRDISLTGCDFSPIPLLSGTFDGRGHSILGISLDGDASTQGLFRMVLKSGVVKKSHGLRHTPRNRKRRKHRRYRRGELRSDRKLPL